MGYTHVRISDETHGQLRAIAEREKRTLTAVLDLAIHNYAQKSAPAVTGPTTEDTTYVTR